MGDLALPLTSPMCGGMGKGEIPSSPFAHHHLQQVGDLALENRRAVPAHHQLQRSGEQALYLTWVTQ